MKNKILIAMLILTVVSFVAGQNYYRWSEKKAELEITDIDPNDMFMVLVDPNGTPSSGLIGREEALLDWPGSTNITTTGDITTGSINKIAADESSDATLTALGQVHVRGDEDRFSAHFGAGGEIAGEATLSGLDYWSISFDPNIWYDSNDVVPITKLSSKLFANGIIIDYWEVDCLLDPDVEMDLDFCYADDWDDVADPNVIDVMDTTNGTSSEDTDANINGGSAVAAGKVVYLRFGADPAGTCNCLNVLIIYHREED